MSDNVQVLVKRGSSAGFSEITLLSGEPAFTLDDGKLYIGNGVTNVLINPDTVPEADKLSSEREISIEGDATGSVDFDGSKDVTLTLTLKNSGVTSGTYTKFEVDSKGIIKSATTLSADDIPSLTLSKISDSGSAASKNAGSSAGDVALIGVDGKLDESIIPAIAITDVFEVSSESAMLGLSAAEPGDVAIRSDLNKCFILKSKPFSIIANWVELRTPTDSVLSVNGKTGAVSLTAADVGAEPAFSKNTAFNKDFEDVGGNIKMNGVASAGSSGKVADAGHIHPTDTTRAPLNSPEFTGEPKVPNVDEEDDSTKAANTAFVKKAITGAFTGLVIDGGTF